MENYTIVLLILAIMIGLSAIADRIRPRGSGKRLVLISSLLISSNLCAQREIAWLKKQVDILAAPDMYGRGYVDGGVGKAAAYINAQFRKYGLKTFNDSTDYYQSYTFPVNTFPHIVQLSLNRHALEPGRDFLVHPASVGAVIRNRPVQTIDLGNIKDSISWMTIRNGFEPDGVYLLQHADTLIKYRDLGLRSIARAFPKGFYIIPEHSRLTWLTCPDTVPATIMTVMDSALPAVIKRVDAVVENNFLPQFPSKNILGFVPGTEKPDSFIVFTAHYDHLGEMGRKVIFPGANDNASGTAVLLYLASYYALHPQKYSIAFLSFSGEEVGLLGSQYYTAHPAFPLSRIRLVINMDIVGSASHGLVVYNATENAEAYTLLQKVNAQHAYFQQLYPEEQIKRSDHYSFSEKGVKAIFIFSNGFYPSYHEIGDTPEKLFFEQGDDLVKLLIDFTSGLNG